MLIPQYWQATLQKSGNKENKKYLCGSGTFLIEAALIATNQAPGLKRDFGFMAWKNFDKSLFESLKKSYQSVINHQDFLRIYGSDKDLRAIRVSKKNIVLAGFENCIQLTCKQFNEIKPPLDEGVLVTNPPYGERIGEDEDLENAYHFHFNYSYVIIFYNRQ